VLHSKIDLHLRKARWQRLFLFFALLPALAALSSCGSTTTVATPTISVTGAATTVNVNLTVQFTATIANLSSTLVNWQVNGVLGGNTTYGTIDSNGLYKAPAVTPAGSLNVVVITAVAQAQTSLTATANLTIEPPAIISGVSPASATVLAGGTQLFTATFSSGTGIGVNWFINNSPSCSAIASIKATTTSGSSTVTITTGTISPANVGMQISGGGIPANDAISSVTSATTFTLATPATASNTSETITVVGYANGLVVVNGQNTHPFGLMSNQGNYTAPLIPPPGGAIALSAVSQSDATQTFCVPVVLAYGNASLQGAFAFSTSGRVISTNAFFARAGRFTAGAGTITGGLETYNEVGQGGATQHNFIGSYNIAADGRGVMQLCEDTSASTCTAPTVFFRVVIVSTQQVQIEEFSPSGSNVAQRTASGQILLQDASVITAGNAAMAGAYSFDFSGILTGTTQLSMVGEFSADSRGLFNTSVISTIPGILDINNGGNLSQAQISGTSSYAINANGRGSAAVLTNNSTFPNLAFTIYIVSASRAEFIESDGNAVIAGDAIKQQTSTCTWGTNSLNGAAILETSGRGASGSVTDLIGFTANGTGTATAGSNDENNAGTVSSGTSLGGTYSIDSTAGSCGRGTLSLGSPASHSYVFYMISSSSAVVQETTSGIVGHGFLIRPQTGSVALEPLSSFALNLAGTNAPGLNAKREDLLGQFNVGIAGSLVANAAGSFGSLDVNNSDGLGTTQTVALTSGTLTAGSRATLALTSAGPTTRNFVLYLVSPTQLFVMSTDPTGIALGSLYQQF
jgi:hypothetical protein